MTRHYVVFKTAVPYLEPRQFVLFDEECAKEDQFRKFGSLESLANELRIRGVRGGPGIRLIKNDLPGDIIWLHDPRTENRVSACVRLTRNEIRELARLLDS